MIGLILFLLLLVGCEGRPNEEELVRACQNRGGIPDVHVQGSFNCEADRQFAQRTPAPARFN